MNKMQLFFEYWPLLLPIILVEIGLMVTAVWHILKHKRYRVGNRVFWLLIVIFFQIFGPICYFIFGRDDAE